MTNRVLDCSPYPEIRIDQRSRVPKYRQIINSIVEDIEVGVLCVGQRVPSINEISEEYYISRDTVEKAYSYLKERHIIVSEKGKGYYIARTVVPSRQNILFLLNKLSSYKLQIYNSFVAGLGERAHVDLAVYHCDSRYFINLLQENAGRYDHYVVSPHFKDENSAHTNESPEVIEALKRIPETKLTLIDNHIPALGFKVASVYQDFRNDIYESLQEGLAKIRRYQKLVFVFPSNPVYPYPAEIVKGFKQFCVNFGFEFDIITQVEDDMNIRPGLLYIIIEETDLVNLMKQLRGSGMEAGRDIGIISYNDTPLKELLGITVISTDFTVMGETTAYMILKRKREVVKNVFHFIDRNSV